MDLWTPVAAEEPYEILALWQGTEVKKDDDVEAFIAERCGTRIKRVGCVITTGGRCDFAFFVHRDDIMKFAVRRFVVFQEDAPRWWEDIFHNDQQGEFPGDFVAFYPDPNSDSA